MQTDSPSTSSSEPAKINPFEPLPPRDSKKFLKYTLGFILLLIRLPLVTMVLIELYLYHHLFKNLIIFKEMKRLITLFVQLILYRVILMICGFTSIKTSHKFFSRDANLPKMASGFVVLCNHTHPFDFLYFSYILSPTFVKMFTKVKANGEKEFLLAPLDFGYTLKYFMSNRFAIPEVSDEVELSRKTPYKKLNPIKLAEHNFFEKEGPIVIFFEGALTNGKGVLDIDPILVDDLYDYQKKYYRNTIVASISYDDNANATSSSPLVSCLSLLMNPINHMTVKFATIPKIPTEKSEMSKCIYDIYETNHELPRVNKNWKDYQEFLDTSNQKKPAANKQDLSNTIPKEKQE